MFNLGQKVTTRRGRKGERPDFYAGKIASQPRTEMVNGRLIEVADVITAETTLAGVQRLASRLENLAFVFPARRPEQTWVEILDGTPTEPKSVQQAITEQALAAMAYLEGLPETSAEIALSDVEA